MARILIFTGKGGVGKTSVEAAHARLSAGEGVKTLLVSTDMAHNLSDLFQCPVGREEVQITENLYGLEIDPDYMLEHEYAHLGESITAMLSQGSEKQEVSLGDTVMIPGMDELFALLKILDLYEQGEYQRIIIDCAPTGETLSMLKMPELFCWYMEKFFPIGKAAMRVLSPVSNKLFKIQLPDKTAMSEIEKMFVRLIKLQELLKNREVTSLRLVTLPEKMVVEETKRNYMYLNLYGYYVDGIYLNRVLPEEADNPFFREWEEIQGRYIQELKEVFQGIPMLSIPWYDSELRGLEALDRVCREVLAGHPVFSIIEHQAGECYEKTDTGYRLLLPVPLLKKEKLQVYQSATDVVLKVGNFKRNIPIPNTLRGWEISSAGIQEQTLYVDFRKEERSGL